MNLRTGMTKVRVSHKDFSLSSVARDRIKLPYIGKIWDDVIFEATNLGFSIANPQQLSPDAMYFDDVITALSLNIVFSVQVSTIRISAEITVKTIDHKEMTERYVIDADDSEIIDVLDAFFQHGGQGVRAPLLTYFSDNYQRWKQSKKII